MQLMGSVSVLMNRPAGIVHSRLDLVKFPLHLVPMKNVGKHHERENRLYKDVFFVNGLGSAHATAYADLPAAQHALTASRGRRHSRKRQRRQDQGDSRRRWR